MTLQQSERNGKSILGTGFVHYIPLLAYLGFGLMSLVSLAGRPLLGFYYIIPFLPYRTMRDHFLEYPLGANALTVLIVAVIIGALIHGKRLPPSKLYTIWLILGVYLYLSMWIGTALGNAPAPLWLSDINFVTWKDYIVIPLVFVAAGLVIEQRSSIRMVIILTAATLLFIDRSCLLESLSRSWVTFDESKRGGGPLSYGPNQTAAFLAQMACFFWGLTRFVKHVTVKVVGYLIVSVSVLAIMYTFSRGGYLALLFGVFVLGVVNDRKLLLVLGVFLLTWQLIVPNAVRERVVMTHDVNGQLEASAQERVDLWTNAERAFFESPVVGSGYATFQMGQHVDNLKDTHNWYIKVLVETGVVGFIIVLFLLYQMFSTAYRTFKHTVDPLYRGLGLGLLIACCACIVSNGFGDRWTYLEITAPLWVLVAAAIRALQLSEFEAGSVTPDVDRMRSTIMAYR